MNDAALLALVRGAEAAADVAGAVIRPFFRAGVASDLKSDASPVTIADRTAEQAMRAVLSERFPGHGILGEEFGLQNPGSELRWVLDPIDGTRAFITGRPSFGTLIGLLDGDTPIIGIIDQPITGERWVGARGMATTFRGPFGGRAATRACASVGQAELGATTPDMFRGADAAAWARLTRAAGRTYYGGDCYTYGLVALGQVDISVDATMNVWDWTALVPVVEGAGGRVTDWQGNPLRPDGDGRTVAVGDPALLAQVLDILAS
ncbi:MAG: histidinol-phosphatase [Acetobacteraceae bacterium]|nr:histidinol-phosphatase [Acetobacteraceae bacterium]